MSAGLIWAVRKVLRRQPYIRVQGVVSVSNTVNLVLMGLTCHQVPFQH